MVSTQRSLTAGLAGAVVPTVTLRSAPVPNPSVTRWAAASASSSRALPAVVMSPPSLVVVTAPASNLDLSDLNSLYGADQFLTDDESDVTASGYDALVEEGIRFPWAATALSSLQLDNPINGSVTMTADGLMVPNYTSIEALVVGALVPNETVQAIPLADYQFGTHQLIQRSVSRSRLRFGTFRNVCTNASFWAGGRYDSVTGVFTRNGETFEVRDANGNIPAAIGRVVAHIWYRVRQFWADRFEETYWEYQPVISSVQGVQIGQTFVNGQARYCTGLSLGLTQIGPTGNVTVALCETRSDGTPNPNRVLAQSTLAQTNLRRFPEWTLFPIRPTLLKQGGRYGVLVITGGAHYIGTVSGSNFSFTMARLPAMAVIWPATRSAKAFIWALMTERSASIDAVMLRRSSSSARRRAETCAARSANSARVGRLSTRRPSVVRSERRPSSTCPTLSCQAVMPSRRSLARSSSGTAKSARMVTEMMPAVPMSTSAMGT